MNTGTQAAKEAGNMVDLDSNPTKLIEIVEIGKQLLMTRGALTTFSIANDVAKYFAIIPAAFVGTYPGARRAQRHAARDAGERHPLGRHLQRAHHRRAHPARAARRALPRRRRGGAAARQPAHLRPRRHRRALHRHQGSSTWRWSRSGSSDRRYRPCRSSSDPRLVLLVAADGAHRRRLPAARHRRRAGRRSRARRMAA